jgi:hypothetical protein
MPLPSTYSTGTASVANGATTITFSGAILGTASQPNIQAGDLFVDPAQPLVPAQRIDSVDYGALTAELWVAWPGTSMTSDPYEVRYTADPIRSTAQTRRLLEQLSVVEANGRGLFYTFDTTTTDADPGAGKLRLNNATIGSATAAYLDNLDADGATVSTILDTWDDGGASGGRGQLWLRSIADPSIFHAFNVTGSVVDGTGYRKLTLSYIGGSGSFASGDELMAMFLPAGTAGTTGTDGGIVLTFSSTTSGDPGAGFFRLDNATHASATAVLIDNTDGASGTISGLVDTWDDSTTTGVKGTLRIIATGNAAIWRVYSVGAVTDSTGFRTVALTYVAGNGTLANGTECSLFFSRTGDKGTDGTNGTNGVTAGLRYNFSTTTTDSDPGAGNLRLNNASAASATAAYLDNVDSDGATATGLIDTWDDSSSANKGRLTIRSANTPTTYATFAVTGSVVDGTGYRKLTLSYLAGNGSLSNGAAIGVVFERTGDGGGVSGLGSTDNALLRADGTGGATAQGSAVIVDDSGNITSFGGNIKFPATQAASADANTLDDYEEGTWTPVLAFGGASVGITYLSRAATYVKIGKLVTARTYISLSNKGSSTGAASVTGLPFASAATPAYNAVSGGFYNNFSGLSSGLGGYISASSTEWIMRTDASTDSGPVTNSNFTNSSEIIITFNYEV